MGQMVISEISKYLKFYKTLRVSINYSRIGAVWLANWCGIVNVKLWTFLNNWGQSGDFFGNDSENGNTMFERTNKFLVIKISTWAAQSVATSNRLFYSSKLKNAIVLDPSSRKKLPKNQLHQRKLGKFSNELNVSCYFDMKALILGRINRPIRCKKDWAFHCWKPFFDKTNRF